jgi:hypothetical protein
MMMVAVVPLTHQFKSRRPVAEIKSLHHPHLLQQMHRPVNRRQITLAGGQGGENLLVRKRMRVVPENFQDGGARTGDFPRLLAQTAGQRGQFLPLMGVSVGVAFHYDSKITLAMPKIKPTKTATSLPTGNR